MLICMWVAFFPSQIAHMVSAARLSPIVALDAIPNLGIATALAHAEVDRVEREIKFQLCPVRNDGELRVS